MVPEDSVLRQRHPFSSNASAWSGHRRGSGSDTGRNSRVSRTSTSRSERSSRRLHRLRRRGPGRSRARGIVGGDPESLQAGGDRLQGHLPRCRDDAGASDRAGRGQRRQRLVACDSEQKPVSSFADIIRFRIAQFRGAYLGFSSDQAPEAELLRRFYYPPEWVARPGAPERSRDRVFDVDQRRRTGLSDMPPVTAIVPMRHSSERVRGKNYRDLGGRPLFRHVVDALLTATTVDRSSSTPTVPRFGTTSRSTCPTWCCSNGPSI